ncbi:MAG: amidohydrolase family protein [Pseudomonadota bacterium]
MSDHSFPVVDAHAHIFTRDMPLTDKPRHRPAYDFTLEEYLATLDAHGVQHGVIAAASPWGDYNDYTIASVRGKPRLRGTVIVRPDVELYILAQMQRDGIVGVRLPFIGLPQPPDLSSFEYRRLLKRIANLDWHVHLHVEAERLPELLPQLQAAGVKTVVDHLGRLEARDCPDGAPFRALLAAVETGSTWIKASGPHRVAGATQILRLLSKELGDERLVWASDCPFVGEESRITYATTLAWLKDALPDPASQRRVLSDNALALYGFGP